MGSGRHLHKSRGELRTAVSKPKHSQVGLDITAHGIKLYSHQMQCGAATCGTLCHFRRNMSHNREPLHGRSPIVHVVIFSNADMRNDVINSLYEAILLRLGKAGAIEYNCLSVPLCVYLSVREHYRWNRRTDLHHFCAYPLWPYLGPLPAALR